MKLLLDQGLPRSTVLHLANAGIEAEHIGNLGMAKASDELILDAARKRQATVVTLDADLSSSSCRHSRRFAIRGADTNRGIERRSTSGDSRASNREGEY